jgi:uncharacterized protein with HEPN domain
MQPEARDAAHLWDMLDAARTIRKITAGYTAHQYLQDRKAQLAVERLVEIIGEAANRVSKTLQQAHPEIPWRSIIAQRHVLAHEYGEIQQERMWTIATQHVPDLIALLEPLIPPLPPGVEP